MLKIKFKCSNQLDACDFGGYCLLQSLYTSSMCSSLIIMDSYLTNECISALFPKKKKRCIQFYLPILFCPLLPLFLCLALQTFLIADPFQLKIDGDGSIKVDYISVSYEKSGYRVYTCI